MLVFLDIDGVLATGRSYVESNNKLYRPAIISLNYLCDSFKVEGIVIMSSWRVDHSLANLQKIMTSAGVKTPVIGVTKILSEPKNKDLSRGRGAEIIEWINDHEYCGDYVVVDDDIKDIIPHIPTDKVIYVENGWENRGLTPDMISNFIKTFTP